MFIKLYITICIIILLIFTGKSLQRFVSEKNHEPADRGSIDYFEKRGLILDDDENQCNRNNLNVLSPYMQQPLSLMYALNYAPLRNPIEANLQQSVLPIVPPLRQDNQQQINQAKLLQQLQRYKDELQHSQLSKMNSYANSNILGQNLKQPPLYVHAANNENSNDLYNNNMMQMPNQQQIPPNAINLAQNRGQPMYLINDNHQNMMNIPNEIEEQKDDQDITK